MPEKWKRIPHKGHCTQIDVQSDSCGSTKSHRKQSNANWIVLGVEMQRNGAVTDTTCVWMLTLFVTIDNPKWVRCVVRHVAGGHPNSWVSTFGAMASTWGGIESKEALSELSEKTTMAHFWCKYGMGGITSTCGLTMMWFATKRAWLEMWWGRMRGWVGVCRRGDKNFFSWPVAQFPPSMNVLMGQNLALFGRPRGGHPGGNECGTRNNLGYEKWGIVLRGWRRDALRHQDHDYKENCKIFLLARPNEIICTSWGMSGGALFLSFFGAKKNEEKKKRAKNTPQKSVPPQGPPYISLPISNRSFAYINLPNKHSQHHFPPSFYPFFLSLLFSQTPFSSQNRPLIDQ